MKKLHTLIPYLGYFLGTLLLSTFLVYSFALLSPSISEFFQKVPKEITVYQTGYLINDENEVVGEKFYWEVKGIDGRDIKFIRIEDTQNHYEKELFDMRDNKDESGEILYYGFMESPIMSMAYDEDELIKIDSVEI